MDSYVGFFVGEYPKQVNGFEINPLENSVVSGQKIARNLSLALTGLETKTFVNHEANLEAFSRAPRRCERLWFHFVGHGTSDALLMYDKTGGLAAVTPEMLASQLHNVIASQVLVVIDCCYSGAFCEKLREVLKGLGSLDHYHILSSTSENELAWEDNKLGSTCFSLALFEAIKGAKLNDPYFGVSEKFAEISKGTSASAFGLKRGAQQHPKLWCNDLAPTSLTFGHALSRRLTAVLILFVAASTIALTSAKLTVQRYGLSPEGELVIQRGPKFLSFTEKIVGLVYEGHSDIVARTGLQAGTNFQDLSDITEQRIWWIRGRAGENGIDVSLERLLASLYSPFSDDLRARTVDHPSIIGELAPQPAALGRMIRGPVLGAPPWPTLEEISSLVPPCGYFEPLPPGPELERVYARHAFFSQEALSRGSVEATNYLTALAQSENRAAFYFDGSNSRGLVGSSSQISHGLLHLVRRLVTLRGRSELPASLSTAERNNLFSTLLNLMPSEVQDDERAECLEYAEFFASILGQADDRYEAEAWSDLFLDLEEQRSWREPAPEDDEIWTLGDAVPAMDRLTALVISGQLEGSGPILAEIKSAFELYSSSSNSFSDEQSDLVDVLMPLALNGEVPQGVIYELLQAIDYLDTATWYDDYFYEPNIDELKIIWVLSLQAPFLDPSDYLTLASRISFYEDLLKEFYENRRDTVPADQLLAARQTSSDALLLVWANMSRGGEVPDQWLPMFLGKNLPEVSDAFGLRTFDNEWVPNVWTSTHPSIVASAIFGTKNDLDLSSVSTLRDFLIEFEQGKVPARTNTDPISSFGTAFVNDPNMRYASICYSVGRSDFAGLSKPEVVEKIRQQIFESVDPNNARISVCPLGYWVAAQPHIDQQEYIDLFREMWASEEDWIARNQISNLIVTTLPLDLSNSVFFD